MILIFFWKHFLLLFLICAQRSNERLPTTMHSDSGHINNDHVSHLAPAALFRTHIRMRVSPNSHLHRKQFVFPD